MREGGTERDQADARRFTADLVALVGELGDRRIGVAVSGGPDSLALLLLAARAFPGRIAAATVDHGLRTDSRAEAERVADICRTLGVPHAILTDPIGERGSLQMRARALRYRLLRGWAREARLALLVTAHHQDDQAETVLMRVARGSGVGGLAGIRRLVAGDPHLVRPLLGWSRADLARAVADAGLEPTDDPANRDPRHDRTAARRLMAAHPELRPARLAAVAANARDADDALDWSVAALWEARCAVDGDRLLVDVSGLPREYRRRLLVRAIARLAPDDPPPRGDRIARFLDRLDGGFGGTIGALLVHPGPPWRIGPAPPRRKPRRP